MTRQLRQQAEAVVVGAAVALRAEVAVAVRLLPRQVLPRPVMHLLRQLLQVDVEVALRAEVEVAVDVEAAEAAQQPWMLHRRRRKAR